jgi:hypothetical protein
LEIAKKMSTSKIKTPAQLKTSYTKRITKRAFNYKKPEGP